MLQYFVPSWGLLGDRPSFFFSPASSFDDLPLFSCQTARPSEQIRVDFTSDTLTPSSIPAAIG